MRLKIDHVGKIEHGDFEFRGMTVIAGNNNTGKSTVGKTLFPYLTLYMDLRERLKMNG